MLKDIGVKSKLIIVIFGLFLWMQGCINEQNSDPLTLKEKFKDNFSMGVALNKAAILGKDSNAVRLVKEHFNSITAENVMKWEIIHPEEDKYSFELADAFVDFGEKNGMKIIGHTLVWHNQTPAWVFKDHQGKPVSREVLLQRMKDHIFTVVGRYKGRVHGWDVVNEAFEDDGSFRDTPWYQILGEEYLYKAFEFAHQADPEAELYYNDYSMWHQGRRNAVVKMVENLRKRGLQIDGIGIQGHWALDYPSLDELEESIKIYGKLNVQLMITELDISVLPNPHQYVGAEIKKLFELKEQFNPYPNGLPDSVQVQFTKRYMDFFRLFLRYDQYFQRITFWGVSDAHSWRNNWPILGRSDYPLLFDRDYQPKPIVYRLLEMKK